MAEIRGSYKKMWVVKRKTILGDTVYLYKKSKNWGPQHWEWRSCPMQGIKWANPMYALKWADFWNDGLLIPSIKAEISDVFE